MAASELPHIASAVNDTLRAENCDSLGFVPSLCGTLMEYSRKAGWSVDQEKRYLLNIFGEGGIMPNHEFIKNWNAKLEFGSEAPYNASTGSRACSDYPSVNCIADAWIRTFSVMPSFIENSTFFINGRGDVQTGYYYDLSSPPTEGRDYACSRSTPSNNRHGDCKTEFWYEDLSTFKIMLDGAELFSGKASEYGENKIEGFLSSAVSPKFTSSLSIVNRIWRKHYEWDKGGVCKTVCYTTLTGTKCKTYYHFYCEYKDTDSVDETMSLSHSFEGDIKQFSKPAVGNDIVLQNVKTTPEGAITSNAKDYKLFLGEAVLHKAGSKYPIEYSYEPYNILALERVDDIDYFVEDLYVDRTENDTVHFRTYPYNMDECSFAALWPFDHDTEGCTMLKKATTTLDIEAGERRYELDEQVELRIDFDSDDSNDAADIRITYGSRTKTVSVHGTETISLEPQEGYHSVKAEFAGDSLRSPAEASPEPVYASDDTFSTYIGIALVFFVVYGMAYFARRYLPG